jgi:protocadherin alpha
MVFSTGCPREEGYLLIIIGVILGIVAIGAALLLIWKLLATIQVIHGSLK